MQIIGPRCAGSATRSFDAQIEIRELSTGFCAGHPLADYLDSLSSLFVPPAHPWTFLTHQSPSSDPSANMSTVQPMSHSTANWHWKNKNISPWAKQWFERELTAITIAGDDGESVQVTEVAEFDGDVELGQRKSKYVITHHVCYFPLKPFAARLECGLIIIFFSFLLHRLITIYDVKIELKWSGTASDGTEVNGKLVIPEVSHEVTLDGLSEYTVWSHIHPLTTQDYSQLDLPQYSWTLSTKSSKPVNDLYQLAKQRLQIALEAKFAEFPAAIIETHGRDLTVSTEPSRTGTPVPAINANSANPTATTTAPAPKPVAKSSPPKRATVNTSTVEVEATFMAAAHDLFSLFTDEKRIPAWTRGPAQVSLIFGAYIRF